MKAILILILAASLCGCQSTLPPGTTLIATSGKQTVAVDASGKTWKATAGILLSQAMQIGAQIAANAIAQKYGPRSENSK